MGYEWDMMKGGMVHDGDIQWIGWNIFSGIDFPMMIMGFSGFNFPLANPLKLRLAHQQQELIGMTTAF